MQNICVGKEGIQLKPYPIEVDIEVDNIRHKVRHKLHAEPTELHKNSLLVVRCGSRIFLSYSRFHLMTKNYQMCSTKHSN
jgi:hypothetical protein